MFDLSNSRAASFACSGVRRDRRWLRTILAVVRLCIAQLTTTANSAGEFEAISAQRAPDYRRARLDNGTFAPELVLLAPGARARGDTADRSVTQIGYSQIADEVRSALAEANYIVTGRPENADLVIYVSWGLTRSPIKSEGLRRSRLPDATQPSNEPSVFPEVDSGQTPMETVDEVILQESADLLGYPSPHAAELMRRRYYIILTAYRSHTLVTPGKAKPLWQTRMSIERVGNDFDGQLPAMLLNAVPFFGQDSQGLARKSAPAGLVSVNPAQTTARNETPDTKNPTAARKTSQRGNVNHRELGAALSPDGAHFAYLAREKKGYRLVIVTVEGTETPLRTKIQTPHLIPLNWADSSHVALEGSGWVDLSGRVAKTTPLLAASPSSPRVNTEDNVQNLVQRVATKLVHRQVELVDADDAGQRVLVVARNATGEARFFVADARTDLVYEVGRRDAE